MKCKLFGHKYIMVAGFRYINIKGKDVMQLRMVCNRCGHVDYK